MITVQQIIEEHRIVWYTNYGWRPAKLFDEVNRALSIFVSSPAEDDNKSVYTTSYQKWYSEIRNILFELIHYINYNEERTSFWVPKLTSTLEKSILDKVLTCKETIDNISTSYKTNSKLYYRTTGGLYWKVFTNYSPKYYCNGVQGKSSRETSLPLRDSDDATIMVGFLSSNLFWWWYTITSNLRDLNPSDIKGIHFPKSILYDKTLKNLCQALLKDMEKNSTMLTRMQKGKGETKTQSFRVSLSKPIIDEIDKVLARHYGFTDEELDFIINYDIKYRMGEELNEE